VTVGGEISVIPRRAVTVGMHEISNRGSCGSTAIGRGRARSCTRVARSITAACPASLVALTPMPSWWFADYVAALPTFDCDEIEFLPERVLSVVAHPDDAELFCAGTLARAQADGAEIALCVLCRGDKGQPDPPIDNLGRAPWRNGRSRGAAGRKALEGGYGDGSFSIATRPAVG